MIEYPSTKILILRGLIAPVTENKTVRKNPGKNQKSAQIDQIRKIIKVEVDPIVVNAYKDSACYKKNVDETDEHLQPNKCFVLEYLRREETSSFSDRDAIKYFSKHEQQKINHNEESKRVIEELAFRNEVDGRSQLIAVQRNIFRQVSIHKQESAQKKKQRNNSDK